MAAAADVWQLRNFPSTLKTPRHDQTMKIHALLLALSSLTLAQPEGDALLPARWLEDIAATDNSIQRTLVFNAIAGVLYTVQSSENLNDWTSEETHYGLGHDILVPMFERTPPPPLPPGTPPTESPPRPIFASITMRREAPPGTGTILSWRSLEGGEPIITRTDTALHPDWENHLLHTHRAAGYYLFIFTPYSATTTSPPSLPTLSTADQALFDHLETSLPAMNLEVENIIGIVRASPPPASSSTQKRFWRIKADWSLDTDGDGIPDWLEYQFISLAADANNASYDAHNGDTNSDGVPDGVMKDSDGDGIPDDLDAAPLDRLISTMNGPRWRYAVFRIAGRQSEENSPNPPQMVNAEGKILYRDAIWHDGFLHPLSQEKEGHIRNAHALSINDNGKITGWGIPERQPTGGSSDPGESGGSASTTPIISAWWDSMESDPDPVESDGGFLFPVSINIPSEPGQMAYPYDSLLSADDAFLADFEYITGTKTRVIVRPAASTGFDVIPDVRLQTEGYDARFMIGVSPTVPGLSSFWGTWETGSRLCDVFQTYDFDPLDITRYQRLPSANPARRFPIVIGNGGSSMVHCRDADKDNDFPDNINAPSNWRPLWSSVNPTIDMSDNSVRLVAPSTLFQDIRSGPFIEWAPALSDADVAPEWINASDNGWQLSHWPSTGQANLSMPVLLEDTVEFTGVDSFSLSGNGKFSPLPEVTDGTQEKSWIMVPKGGEPNEFKLHSLAGNGNTLTLEAPGLLFGNATGTTEITTSIATLSLSASPESENISSGAEIDFNLRLGTGAQSISMPLAAKVMKRRTLNVAVYKVLRERPGHEPAEPLLFPTEGTLENRLNQIFKPQINTEFNVTIQETPIVANMSTGVPDELDYNADGSHSAEQEAIHSDEGSYNIRVYVLGSSLKSAFGITSRENRACWIAGGFAAERKGIDFMIETIAHEIGHVLVGYGHPNDYTNQFTLPGTAHHKRLMRSGGLNRPDSGHLLVKHEWDAAEEWLSQNIDTPTPDE